MSAKNKEKPHGLYKLATNEKGELGFINDVNSVDDKTVYVGIPIDDRDGNWLSFNPTIFPDEISTSSLMEMVMALMHSDPNNRPENSVPKDNIFLIGPKGSNGPSDKDHFSTSIPLNFSGNLDELFKSLFNMPGKDMKMPDASEFHFDKEYLEDDEYDPQDPDK